MGQPLISFHLVGIVFNTKQIESEPAFMKDLLLEQVLVLFFSIRKLINYLFI